MRKLADRMKWLICFVVDHDFDMEAMEQGHLYCRRCGCSPDDFTAPFTLRGWLSWQWLKFRVKMRYTTYKVGIRFKHGMRDDDVPF